MQLETISKKTIKAMKSGDFFFCKQYDQGKYFSMLPIGVSFKQQRLDKEKNPVEHAHHGYWLKFTKN